MNDSRRTRVLVAKAGLDGHDRGAKAIARVLQNAGLEVIYTGLHQTPEMIVNAAIQEDVDVIGLSILSGNHLEISEVILEQLKMKKVNNIILVVGGTIMEKDVAILKNIGVAEIFPTETNIDDIISFFKHFAYD